MGQQNWGSLSSPDSAPRSGFYHDGRVISRKSTVDFFSVFPRKALSWQPHLKESSPPCYDTVWFSSLCFTEIWNHFVYVYGHQFLVTGRCNSGHSLGFILLPVKAFYQSFSSKDMSLSKREIVEERGAWRAAVHEVAKSQIRLSDWTTNN